MIARVWLKILFIILVVTVPLLVGQFLLEKQSIELIFDLAQKMSRSEMIDSHLDLLKRMASLDRKNQELYKGEFQRTIDSKIALQDVLVLKQSVTASIVRQTLQMALALLVLCLVFSFFISRNLVGQFQKLVRENLRHARRLELFHAIESWQKFARMLVHELRGPLTPIKLISGDIVDKYGALPAGDFASYLNQGAVLISEQVATVEKMIENFLKFAKLPTAQRRPIDLVEVVATFVSRYAAFRPESVSLRCLPEVAGPVTVTLDPVLISNLFFNLLKNAAEANADRAITILFRIRAGHRQASVLIENDGSLIPGELVERIFEPYVTSQKPHGQLNLGLGLTISKKIALDHDGDLVLQHNDAVRGVVFELQLPREKEGA